MSRVASICKTSKQRGNALVLLLLLKTWDGGEAPDHYELADLAHISPRQAERDLSKLVDDGDVERLSPEHNGGRGHKTRYRVKGKDSIPTPAQTASHLSESDKTPSDVTDFKVIESTSEVAQLPETTTDVTDLSDSNGVTSDGVPPTNYVTSDGTPIAPLDAKNTSTDNVEANASTAPRAVSLKSYIGGLIQFREGEIGSKLPNTQREGAAAKWMYEQGWPAEDVQACYRYLVKYGKRWRHSGVTLNDVKSQIADWKKGNLSDDERPQRNGKPSRSELTKNRDYSRFRRGAGSGGGESGADTRPLSDFDGLATPVRR